ncbi:MAG: hypothetical protein JOZ16_11380, partial [Methylobacteriaceae bacterium]|nr:hypothetical protein [Methylobacteriaceae bacterium]
MDNDDIVTRDSASAQPIGGDYEPTGSDFSAIGEDGERNPVFSHLVTSDNDIVGLVAYSIYKQNKLDWLLAFQRAVGREPSELENTAYIIGEATPRRLATYRHLAESTLAGSGPDVPSATGKPGDRPAYAYRGKPGAQNRPNTLVVAAILAVVVIVAIVAAV